MSCRLKLAALALVLGATASAQSVTADSLMTLRRSVAFVFQARIDSLSASTVAVIPRSPHTIAVTANESLQCPQEVGPFLDAPITVYVDDTTGLAPGQQWWFFARGWIAGHGLAVREVARFHTPFVDSVMTAAYLGRQGFIGDLQRHLLDTVSIVTGRLAPPRMRSLLMGGQAVDRSWQSSPLTITGILNDSTDQVGAVINIGIPVEWQPTARVYQPPDTSRRFLFFLHPIETEPQRTIIGPRPPYVLRDTGDVRLVADSAKVVAGLQQIKANPGPVPIARCRP